VHAAAAQLEHIQVPAQRSHASIPKSHAAEIPDPLRQRACLQYDHRDAESLLRNHDNILIAYAFDNRKHRPGFLCELRGRFGDMADVDQARPLICRWTIVNLEYPWHPVCKSKISLLRIPLNTFSKPLTDSMDQNISLL
jgi:hypothetical protein